MVKYIVKYLKVCVLRYLMVDDTGIKSQYQGFSIKKDFAKMIQKHIADDPRFNNMVDFVKFSVLKQIEHDKANGSTNYQPKEGGEERTTKRKGGEVASL